LSSIYIHCTRAREKKPPFWKFCQACMSWCHQMSNDFYLSPFMFWRDLANADKMVNLFLWRIYFRNSCQADPVKWWRGCGTPWRSFFIMYFLNHSLIIWCLYSSPNPWRWCTPPENNPRSTLADSYILLGLVPRKPEDTFIRGKCYVFRHTKFIPRTRR